MVSLITERSFGGSLKDELMSKIKPGDKKPNDKVEMPKSKYLIQLTVLVFTLLDFFPFDNGEGKARMHLRNI